MKKQPERVVVFVIIFAQNTIIDFDTDCISAFLWVRNESLFLNTFDYICNQKNIETHFGLKCKILTIKVRKQIEQNGFYGKIKGYSCR